MEKIAINVVALQATNFSGNKTLTIYYKQVTIIPYYDYYD